MCIRDRLGTLATLVSAEVACITYRLETCTAWLFSGVIRTPTDVGTTSDQVASSRSCIDTSFVRACCEHTHADVCILPLHPPGMERFPILVPTRTAGRTTRQPCC